MARNNNNTSRGSQSYFKVASSLEFFSTGQITLHANVGSFGGQRPGVSFAKRYRDPNTGEWFESKKRFFMDVDAFRSLSNKSDEIKKMTDSLVSCELLLLLFLAPYFSLLLSHMPYSSSSSDIAILLTF